MSCVEVYAGLPDASPHKMNQVVKGAVNLCTAIYITIGAQLGAGSYFRIRAPNILVDLLSVILTSTTV